MDAEMPRYRYKSLLPHEDTRIIILLPPSSSNSVFPGNPNGIQCEIHHVNLATNPQYEALSYCWGDPTETIRYIKCDGARVNVTFNLYSALLRIRREDRPIRIWADSICINQGDEDEKALQVSRMGKIYTQSARTLIWLGEETHDVQGSLQFATQLQRASLIDNTPVHMRHVWGFPNQDVSTPDDDCWRQFFALFQRPWFRRVWIIQEAALSPRLEVLCGTSRVPWDTLQAALNYTSVLGIQSAWGDPVIYNIVTNLQNARKEFWAGHPRSLAKLVVRTRVCLASNPRDKLYGLWGIADQASIARLQLVPSYRISPEELYKQFAKAVLRTDRNLDILQMVGNLEGSQLSTTPSWVPDWSASSCIVPLRHLEIKYAENEVPEWQDVGFMATGRTRLTPFFSDDENHLGLKGHIIAKIERVSCLINTQNDNRTDPFKAAAHLYSYWSALRDCKQVSGACSGGLYFNGERMLDCYWQTLSAAVMPGGYDVCRDEFEMWDGMIRTAHFVMSLCELIPWLHNFAWFQLAVTLATMALAKLRGYGFQEAAGFQGNIGACFGRRMARTREGYIALVPEATLPEDCIALFEGGKVPLVISPKDKEGKHWRLIGETYVHGKMRGEAFDQRSCRHFWIV